MHVTIIDTPGMVEGKVVEEAFRTIETADVALLVTSPDVELTQEEHDLVRYLAIKKLPTLLVVNKMDLVSEEVEGEVLASYRALGIGNPLPFSARRREGLDSLAAAIEPLYHIHTMRKVEND
uniref:GTPase Era n=1 Tax=Lygus hesperus TaxID=30085 RepID=A0A0A9YEW8_LYGHE